jgi:hypothetical protein
VQPLEVLLVAVEERILVVPLDLKRDRAGRELADVIDLVTLTFQRPFVDDALNGKVVLAPSLLTQSAPKPLRALSWTLAVLGREACGLREAAEDVSRDFDAVLVLP